MTLKCNGCGQLIVFDDTIKSKSGKKIPLNIDKSRHECPNSDYAKRKSQNQNQNDNTNIRLNFTTADNLLEENIIEYVKGITNVINEKLKLHRIVIVIKDTSSS